MMKDIPGFNRDVEGSKGGCFPAHTRILTPDGPRPMGEIQEGDAVICYDEKGELHEGRVTKKVSHPEDYIIRVHFWGGKIDVTTNHLMLNQYNTFAPAGSFTNEDSFINQDGHCVPIKKIENVAARKVYNLHVEPHATFIADGIRVHNGGVGIGRAREFIEGQKGGGKGGGGSVYVPKEAPNTLRSASVARVVDVISEGDIEGPALEGLQWVVFNETRVQNEDGTFNFSGVRVVTRTGTPDQAYIDGFPSVETEVGVGVEVKFATPVVRTITDDSVNAVIVKARLPSLTKQTTNGDLNGSSVRIKLYRQSNGGGYVLIHDVTISGKTTSPYEAQYRIDLDPGGAPWDIKFERVTADSDDDATLSDSTIWSTYTRVIDNKIRYSDTAVVGVEIDAEQFAEQVPARAYEIYGIKVKIPSNYNPETRAYTGLWDGTFVIAWTNNPAWVLYDLMTNVRYGIGESIKAAQIDKFALYEIAQYCDELVPDGAGGTEPRYTFNGVINTQEEAYTVLNAIASTFRGMLYWASGLVTATTDKPEDSKRIISPANVVGGMINYSGTSLKTRHSVAIVRWNDPDDGFNSALVAYEDPELIQKFGWKPKDLVAYGCTSRGQAFRMGRWFIDTEKNSTEIATYRASFDNADLLPGQIIYIADPTYMGARYGGRLVAGAVDEVTLDAGVVLSIGQEYTLAVIMPDGTVEEKPISTASDGNSHALITLDEDFSQVPANGAMWALLGTDASPRPFRVVSITEVEKNIYEVSALYHDVTKYDRIEQNIDIDEPSFSLLPDGPMQPPTDLGNVEYLYLAQNGIVKSAVSVSWTSSPDPRKSYHQVQVMKPGTDFWDNLGSPRGTSIDLFDISPGVYSFRVRAVNAFGVSSDWFTETFNLLGVTAPPSDVTGFRINNVGTQANLTWNHVTDLDLDYYIIKYSHKTEDAQWGEGVILAPRVGAGTSYFLVPSLIGTYMIKAVDKSGTESLNAGLIVSNIGDISQNNVVVELIEDPDFDGVLDNAVIDSGTIKLDDLSQIGYYYFDNELDLGDVFTSRVVPQITAFGEDITDTIDEWDTLSSVTFMSTVNPEDWRVQVQIRTTNENPAIGVWSEWSDIVIGDYTCRAFQFRVVLTSLNDNTTPVVEDLSVTIDMPDRTESEEDVVSDPGDGTYTVTYAFPFKVTPNVQITGQDLNSGDKYDFLSKDETGFVIRWRDSSNNPLEITFDWLASGYGRLLPFSSEREFSEEFNYEFG